MAESRVSRLLSAVWGNREGFIFLPYKDQSRVWHEVPGIPYDGSIIPEINDLRSDRYFCPLVFSEPKRKKEFALPTNLLWADLDPVHPDACRIRPSIAWESSPGRYQALWFLSKEIPADQAAQLSKRIAYADGADRGGWDVTQVLRIPGTRNHKYESTPEVKLLWAKRQAYSPNEIRAAYPKVNGESKTSESTESKLDLWSVSVPPEEVASAITSLPIGIRRKLSASTSGADRSLELQKLARDILKFGVEPATALRVLQQSTWNKFAGRSDEREQLLKQVTDAQEVVVRRKAAKDQPKTEGLTEMSVMRWGEFMQIPTTLRWLIDDSWVDQTVGFISGRSKSYKTWLALDMALSVVSGQPFLGRYPVRRTGPVLLVQEEDPSAVLQERLRLVGKMKDMLPSYTYDAATKIVHIEYPDYPLHVINLQGFSLGDETKVDQVRRLIAQINPVMVILDPLVVMLGSVDEYKATEVAGILQSVKMWREEFGCSVLIVHHWNKSKQEADERGGQHMYGSFAFHAWLESALHVTPIIEENQDKIDTVHVEREFKAAPSGRALRLQFDIDTVENYTYLIKFQDDKTISPMMQQILDLVEQSGPQSTNEVAQTTGHPRPRVVDSLGRLVRLGMLKVAKGGGRGKASKYWLPDQEPPPE